MSNGTAGSLANFLPWLDLEMTGLEDDNHVILEISSVITDGDLNIHAEGPSLVIYQPAEELAKMDSWCQNTHTASGLVRRVQESKITMADAEKRTLRFLESHIPPGTAPICGRSIATDRRFLKAQMPQLEKFFHYRHVDVSTIKILASQWNPGVYERVASARNTPHRALDDVYDTIAELRMYKKEFFNCQDTLTRAE